MDAESANLLGRLSLPSLRLTTIEDIERADPELRAVRGSRTSTEYCWTAASAICLHYLVAEPDLDVLTYLDADLHLWSSPDPLFEELGDGSVLLIPHRAARNLGYPCGYFNVGWLTFRNDDRGRTAVSWWRERCLEWCHDRIEDGRFGDQKYLDDWPTRFAGVRVSSLAAAGVGPWNDGRSQITGDADAPIVDGEPLIFFHHSGFHPYRSTRLTRAVGRRTALLRVVDGPAPLVFGLAQTPASPIVEGIWRRYGANVSRALADLVGVGASADRLLDQASASFTAWRLAEATVPASALRLYRRLPLVVRHRLFRSISPS